MGADGTKPFYPAGSFRCKFRRLPAGLSKSFHDKTHTLPSVSKQECIIHALHITINRDGTQRRVRSFAKIPAGMPFFADDVVRAESFDVKGAVSTPWPKEYSEF